MPKTRTGLGAEHPCCDRIQLVLVVLFFVVWGSDSCSYFVFDWSTILVGLTLLPLRVFFAIAVMGLGIYLVAKAHRAVFDGAEPRLIDDGVFSRVRHPMYLGTLLTCLALFFAMPSLFSFLVWLALCIFYDKMATYEENDLVRILGDEYVSYQRRVPKWLPRPRRS